MKKILVSEDHFNKMNSNNELARCQYNNELGESWPHGSTAVATTPPHISRGANCLGNGRGYVIEITRIVVVEPGKGDEYIKLIDFGHGAKSPEESEQRQKTSVDKRREMEVGEINSFYAVGYTERQAWYYFWDSWKKSFPNTRLVLEHQETNDLT